MLPASRRTPSLRLHKPTGQAVVTLDGRDHYLGKYDTPESRANYDRLIAEWLANGRQLKPSPTARQDIRIVEIIAAFWEHAQSYYVKPNGTPTGEADNYKLALRPIKKLFGALPAAQFGPLALEAVRKEMIGMGWTRANVNRQVNRVKWVFKWAVSRELIPASVYAGLQSLPGLRRGQGKVKEAAKVKPVDEAHVESALPHMPRPVAAMVRLQQVAGMRPGEAVVMRPIDIDTTSDTETDGAKRLWFYRPTEHKTAHLDQDRVIAFGARAQAILTPFLMRPPEFFVFSPIEAERERHEAMHALRKTPLSCGNTPGSNRKASPKRPPRDRYTVDSYRRAIARACDRADAWAKGGRVIGNDERIIPHWHPNQLRHYAATRVENEFTMEHAQSVLGHTTPITTANYTARRQVKAQEVMRKIG